MKHTNTINSAFAFDDMCRNIKTVIDSNLFVKFKLSTVKEAISAGYGFNTHAALLAQFKGANGYTIALDAFDYISFIERLYGLIDDMTSVCAIGSIIDGSRLEVKITKRPLNDKYTNTEYSFTALVSKHSGERITSPFDFIMPIFGQGTEEKYRIDSNHMFRRTSVGNYALTRGNPTRSLLNVTGSNGEWSGAIFVYDVQQQTNDSGCLRTISSAVAKRILAAISPRFSMELYRPDYYDYGALRLKVTLGDSALAYFAGRVVSFTRPVIERRLIHVESQNMYTMELDKFNNGVYSADVYSNGVGEDKNPTPENKFYMIFYKEVLTQLTQSGLSIKPYWVS